MQILSVSDEVVPAIYSLNIKHRFSNIDLILGCGDLPFYYLEFIVTMLGRFCFYIRGNHDSSEETETETLYEPRGCVSLENRTLVHEQLLLAGLGGSIRYNNAGGDQYTEREMALRMWRLAPRLFFNRQRYGRYLDILLTHAPPLGIHNGPDRPHRGFRTFLSFMDRFQPRYLIHGHVHSNYAIGQQTVTQYRDTLVINTAGYRVLQIGSPSEQR